MQELFTDKKDFIKQYRAECEASTGRPFERLDSLNRYQALARLIASKLRTR